MNLKKRAMQLAAVLLSLAVLLPSVPAAFASQSAAEGTAVVFSESGITAADESGLSIDGTTLTIEQAGTYVLSGTCSDGSVKVKKGVTGVTLVLSGLDLTSSTTAPITCGKSSGVTILAAEGTENALTDAAANNEAVVEVSAGGGYYVTGTVSELRLDTVKVGQTVNISSRMTGAACTGEVVEISTYPTDGNSYGGDGNPNVSYYPFKVFVSEDQQLQEGESVSISYQAVSDSDGSSLYLENMYVRTENGKSYVMVRGEDGKLEQRWVQTGKVVWDSYTQIRGGLTPEDYVAFPYGRDVVSGAKTEEATVDALYSW